MTFCKTRHKLTYCCLSGLVSQQSSQKVTENTAVSMFVPEIKLEAEPTPRQEG